MKTLEGRRANGSSSKVPLQTLKSLIAFKFPSYVQDIQRQPEISHCVGLSTEQTVESSDSQPGCYIPAPITGGQGIGDSQSRQNRLMTGHVMMSWTFLALTRAGQILRGSSQHCSTLSLSGAHTSTHHQAYHYRSQIASPSKPTAFRQ
jgi:hypothetical protein